MNGRALITIIALVSEAEQPVLVAAAQQLAASLGRAAQGTPWPVRLHFQSHAADIPASPAPNAIITSLLSEADRVSEPLIETEARWRAYLTELQAFGAPVFVCSVFRHIRNRAAAGVPSPTLERIRRLNRLAADLSHDLGVAVIDIDRAFAHIGGRLLQTDYRLAGAPAAAIAGHTAALCLLSVGLGGAVDLALQEQAKAVLGDLQQVYAQANQHLTPGDRARG